MPALALARYTPSNGMKDNPLEKQSSVLQKLRGEIMWSDVWNRRLKKTTKKVDKLNAAKISYYVP